jgi:hypothetical protein
MKWTTTPIEHVMTERVLFFDPEHADTIKRIVKVLHIDCFPHCRGRKYSMLEDDKWIEKELPKKFDPANAFDPGLLAIFEKNDSNILFTESNGFINGVIHFTNYQNPLVFAAIYQNLNRFEQSLRDFIAAEGLSHAWYRKYLDEHARKKRSKEYIEEKLSHVALWNESTPYSELDLTELLISSKSSYVMKKTGFSLPFLHDKGAYHQPDIVESLRLLRNTVMHHKDTTGKKEFSPHRFGDFKKFFHQVVDFKSCFEAFSKTLDQAMLKDKMALNSKRLQLISSMENSEIEKYFYQLI